MRFASSAVLFAVGAAAAESVSLHLLVHDDIAVSFRSWCVSHPLSLVLATPCFLIMSRPHEHLSGGRLSARAVLSLLGMLAVACLIFFQTRFPLLFLAPPALLAVSLEAGLFGAALAVLLTAAVAVPSTVLGYGPIALSRADLLDKVAVLQLFLVVTLCSSIPVAGLQARQRKAQARAEEEARKARCAEALALESEAHFREMTDQASDAICTVDPSGVLTFVSPAAELLTGYAVTELVGRRASDFIFSEDRKAVHTATAALTRGERRSGTPIEYRFRHKDGRWLWLQANPKLISTSQGELMGLVDVVRDVTARKAAEAELESARAGALAAAAAKTEFLANMSHELRTPLTGILGYADVLERDPDLSTASRTHAQRIRTAGSTLLALVNDILDLSKFEAGGVALAPRPTDLVSLLHGSLELVRPQAREKSLAISIEHDCASAWVLVDPDRLQQVMVNLLGNAVKFTPSGVVTLGLRCRRGRDTMALRITVADTGVGIPADRLAHVFDRFEQADASTSRQFGGTGLGLSISRRIVEGMGGAITVESAPNAGSVFCVHLDLPVAETEPVRSAEDPGALPVGLGGMRVLLAEDVAINRELIALFLKPLGVELHMACNGAEAVEAASLRAFHVILMDMQMPVLDGLEATRLIRAGAGPSADAHILALTANVLPAEVERCLTAGMDGHVGKPLTAARLAAALTGATAVSPSRDEQRSAGDLTAVSALST